MNYVKYVMTYRKVLGMWNGFNHCPPLLLICHEWIMRLRIKTKYVTAIRTLAF